jgi:hypothetical protein
MMVSYAAVIVFYIVAAVISDWRGNIERFM